MGWLKNLIAKIAGKQIGKQIGLQEGNVNTKEWWKSKTVWTGVVTVLIAIYNAFTAALGPAIGVNLPPIPEWVFVLLGSFGVYSRVTATKTIQ